MTRRSLLFSAALTPVLALAQGGERKSPHETASLEVDGKRIEIVYGRPSLKGRKAFSGSLAPSGEVWRLGADDATKLTLSAGATLNGTLQAPAGSYALFAIPGATSWTMIVNKTANQWGAFKYDKAQDLGRFQIPVKKTALTEEFTIQLAKAAGNSATVTMAWQDVAVEFPIQCA